MDKNRERQREQLVLDIATEGFWEWEPKADLLYLSPQFCKLTGYLDDVTLFDTNFLRKIIHPDDHQHFFTTIEKLFQEKNEISTIAYRIISKDGAVHWVESRCSAVVHDAYSGESGVVGTVIDVTRQKKGEDELHRLNRALLAIGQCNQAMLHARNEEELLYDICHIVVATGGYRMAWVGYVEHDALKSIRPVAQAGFEEGYLETLVLSWADVERGRGPTGTAIRTGQPSTISNVHEDPRFMPWRKEAIKRGYTSNQSLPLKTGDTVFGALAIYSALPGAFDGEETILLTSLAENLAYGITMLRNNAERKRAEEKIFQLNKTLEERIAEKTKELEVTHQQMILQEKLASIGQLAAGIAHELNNPLNFIKINFATQQEDFADLLSLVGEYRLLVKTFETTGAIPLPELQKLRQMEKELNIERLFDDSAKIFIESQNGFERITKIINSMRSFLSRDAADKKILFDINNGIRNTLILTHNEYRNCADIETTFEELPLVLCNPEQINQVVLNLIVNSAQAIASQKRSGKGKITIHTWFDSKNVYCSIADDGPGIPQMSRPHIFEPFFSTKNPGQGKGRGLGLSICYDIITHKHEGTLSVDCLPEGGTVFIITLPQPCNPVIIDERSSTAA